jgi:hypothetical protein
LHQDLSSKRQGIDAQQSLPNTQMGIVMGLNPGRGVRGLLHRTHRLSLSHPTYSFRDEGGPHAPTGAPHFLILMLEAGGADEPRPPISSQCNERNNVQGGGISLAPEGSLLCYAPNSNFLPGVCFCASPSSSNAENSTCSGNEGLASNNRSCAMGKGMIFSTSSKEFSIRKPQYFCQSSYVWGLPMMVFPY